MFSSCSKLKRTVTLVEKRVKENRSTNSMRDLEFLGEYYSDKRQWAKANAASRHALAVAEAYSSSLEVTAADEEYEQSRKTWQRQLLKRDLVQVTSAVFLAAILLITVLLFAFAVASLAPPRSWADRMADKKSELDLQIKLHPSNAQAYVSRAWFFLVNGRAQAVADCKQALSLEPANSNALQLQVQFSLWEQKYDEALRANENSSHTTSSYYRHRSIFEERNRDYAAQARSLETARQLIMRENESDQGPTFPPFLSYGEIAQAYGKAGQFAKSLRCAELQVAESTTNWDRAQGLVMEAQYLVCLGRNDEAINAANDALSVQTRRVFYTAYAYRSKAYLNLRQYERAIADASKCLALQHDPGSQTYVYALNVRAASFEKLGLLERANSDRKMIHFIQNRGGLLTSVGWSCAFVDKVLLPSEKDPE